MRKFKLKKLHPNHYLAVGAAILFIAGLMILWVASLRIPALESLA